MKGQKTTGNQCAIGICDGCKVKAYLFDVGDKRFCVFCKEKYH
jgi:hypothetical protein